MKFEFGFEHSRQAQQCDHASQGMHAVLRVGEATTFDLIRKIDSSNVYIYIFRARILNFVQKERTARSSYFVKSSQPKLCQLLLV